MNTDKRYPRPAEASDHLRQQWAIRASVATLAKYRHFGNGPRFRHAGRDIIYATEALDEWARGRLSRDEFRSTAEADANRKASPPSPAQSTRR